MAARIYRASPYFLVRFRDKLLILMYHRVIPPTEIATTFVQPGMYVTPETFEQHLRFLTAHFKLLSFDDLLERWNNEDAWDSDARYCVITFDDGWLDNYLYAYPLLCAYRVPATIFLPTELIGTREWLWPDLLGYLLHRHRSRGALAALRETVALVARGYPELDVPKDRQAAEAFDSLIELVKTLPDHAREDLFDRLTRTSNIRVPDRRRLLDWEEVREMSCHGIAFGSHTCTHAALTRLDRKELQRQLRQSLDMLCEQRVNHVPVISYPNGDHTETVVAEARAAGYRAAVTTEAGLESSQPADLFRLKRVGIHDDVSRSTSLLAFHIARHAQPSTGIA